MLIDIEIGTGFSIHILDLNRLEMPQLFYGTSFELLIFLISSSFELYASITNISVLKMGQIKCHLDDLYNINSTIH